MPDGQETPKTGETDAAKVNGSPEAKPATPPSDAPKAEEKPVADEAAEWRKRAQQAEMRANQLQNEREEAERKRLEEANEFKSLYEQEREKNAQREVEEEQARIERESIQLRDSVIDSYDNPVVKEAAQRLIAKNPNALFWSGQLDEAGARTSVKEQLDAMAEVVGDKPKDSNTPAISGNNGLTGNAADGTKKETPEETLKRLDAKFRAQTP